MWIVRLALRRPYTFIVMSALIVILGVAAIVSMPTDIFPNIDIPVVSVIWSYNGVSPDEMASRITTISERAMTTVVNDIEHMESQSYNGVSVIKLYFQPSVKVELAIAQITSLSQTILRVLPPGIFAPGIVKYNAASVPILQLSVNSKSLTEQQLYDYGTNFIRTQLATVQGASVPLPYGGKPRQIMVDLDPEALYAKHLSATDVSNAINAQNLILPAGTAKVGDREYLVRLNSSPQLVSAMNDLPIKTVNGATVYIKDVAQVRDGFAVQANVVRQNGGRSTLLTVLKSGNASTLDIVKKVKEALPRILAGLPPELSVTPLFDQSIFVREAITGVVREGAIAAVLTGLMILLFLGSWRSTLIVCISIPLSILTSLIVMSLFGETLNVMTLGGLALAVGILVDDATVEIENVHRNMAQKKPITRAILDGAQQIAVPAFVSTLAISIVFVPVLLLTGAAKYLFTPLAMAVVFAMMASYFLSRTLVPTMVHFLLRSEIEVYAQGEEAHAAAGSTGIIWRIHHAFNRQFEKIRNRYKGALSWSLDHRGLVASLFGVFCLGSIALGMLVGEDFFPYIDSGQMRLHVRTPQGTRIEDAEQMFGRVEEEIKRQIPRDELFTILDNIGLPSGGINLAFSDSASIGTGDGEILIALNKKHGPTQEYTRKLRNVLRGEFPYLTFFFQPANITNQILNFGLPAPIDIQIVGRDAKNNYKVAREIERRVSLIPGAVDVHIHQEIDYPEIRVNVDRTKADQVGITQRDVANSLLISLSSSGQTAPNQWLNPANGVNYQVAVQTPQYRVDSFDALQRTPISSGAGGNTQLLSNLATLGRGTSTAVVNHYNVQPVFDVYANVDERDLGGVASEIRKIMKDVTPRLPKAAFLELRGQVETMRSSFVRLGIGLIFAIVLVYMLIVVNFQSWLDPFIILLALPGALSGIIWMLFVTQTTFNVPSLMGAIMCIGVATANSILVVTFANDERMEGKDALQAALSAGYTRIRPVTMTALAMIIGMMPMALGLGEGGEQNAPLGRAVIGGLIVATFSTLFFVPIAYSYLRKTAPVDMDRQIDEEAHAPNTGERA
ncbi:MAG: efflux RND transporter permease subunit [Acidobacteriota bacterium]|nr:efflux RND transporter permease subunit [Acidobacteriota bacterium]